MEPAANHMAAAAALLPHVQHRAHGNGDLPPGIDDEDFNDQEQQQVPAAGNSPAHNVLRQSSRSTCRLSGSRLFFPASRPSSLVSRL